jgi:hypothetical protein
MIIQNSLTVFLFVSLFSIFSFNVNGQSIKASKTDSTHVYRAQNIFIEVGAAGLFFSANYDTRFSQQRDGFGGRLGVGTWSSAGTTFITVPLQLNYLVGGRSNFFEAGAGATLMSLNKPYAGNPLTEKNLKINGSAVLPTTTMGYRYQPYNGGLNLRASVNPMLLKGTFIPYFGASIGYTFR